MRVLWADQWDLKGESMGCGSNDGDQDVCPTEW